MAKKKDAPKTPAVPMFGYSVDLQKNLISNEAEESGRWKKVYQHSLSGIAEKTEDIPDITSSLDIPKGTNVIVVWVSWGSGDSFGHASGGNAEAIGIFQDLASARELLAHLDSRNEWGTLTSWKNNTSLDFKTSDGQHHKMQRVGWSGYFESYECARMGVVTIF